MTESADSTDSIAVARLNHAVLYVRDLDVYQRVFGFEIVSRMRATAE